jgi:hypothetical protein
MHDARLSLRLVWFTLTALILFILAAPFALRAETLARWMPVCESKLRTGRPCAFCGMTTSFLAISEGHFGEARRANRGGIPLYLLFISNEICALALLSRIGATACKR